MPETNAILFVLVAGGLFVLVRWVARLGEQNAATMHHASASTPEAVPGPTAASQRAVQPATSPAGLALGPIRITKFYFKEFDALPGPVDPGVFAGELWLELYDGNTGHRWKQSYFVASPKRLAQVLRDKHWTYLYAPEVLVLARYDLQEIQQAIITRLVEDGELLKGNAEFAQEETL